MIHRPTTSRRQAPTSRTARRAGLLVTLIPLLLLLAASATFTLARAETPPPTAEPVLQLGEEEWAEGECVEEAEELEANTEEAEELCEEEDESSPSADACPLRSARGHAVANHNRLKLTIGYTTNSPTVAQIQIHNGRVQTFNRHLGRSGVLRFTEKLPKTHAGIVVLIKPSGGSGCPSRRLVLFRT